MTFIRELPPSLEHLRMAIRGENLCMDEDSDFDPICDLGPEAFCVLRHLRACDIVAWISDLDGGLSEIPECAVHFRRLPYANIEPGANHSWPQQQQEDNARFKKIWTSRMHCVYQEDYQIITHHCDALELGNGEGTFEGKDAERIWWDGTPEACETRNVKNKELRRPTQRGAPLPKLWPVQKEDLGMYPLYCRGF